VRSPLHAGSGSELGVVDLPIQRERHTGYPKIEGSSLKGAIREVFDEYLYMPDENGNKEVFVIENKIKEKCPDDDFTFDKINNEFKYKRKNKDITSKRFKEAIFTTFGPDGSGDRASSLAITDARLLLFPVKSMKGVFAWITCPAVLKRFNEDLEICGETIDAINDTTYNTNKVFGNDLIIKGTKNIVLEEYSFSVDKNDSDPLPDFLGKKTGRGDEVKKRLVILNDDDFSDLVNLTTEVITRNKIDNKTGTVQKGALFTEEYLPAETVLYSLAMASTAYHKPEVFKKKDGKYIFQPVDKSDYKQEDAILAFFTVFLPDIIQVGGNATIGKGLVKTAKWGGE